MDNAASPTTVRRQVHEMFQRLGVASGLEPTESILIRDGRYRGRSYRAGGILAMWMVDVGLVQFYGADGEMLATLEVCVEATEQRRAA